MLQKLFGPLHRDSLAALFMLAKEMAERVLLELGGAPARTRRQKEQVQAALSVVDVGLETVDAAVKFLPEEGGALVKIAWEHLQEHRAALAEAAGAGAA